MNTCDCLRSKCFTWRAFGSFRKLKMIGTKSNDSTKMHMMEMAATTPNSRITELSTTVNVAKPAAVVALVRSVAFPTFRTTRCKP